MFIRAGCYQLGIYDNKKSTEKQGEPIISVHLIMISNATNV
jgi:hypothetical protein